MSYSNYNNFNFAMKNQFDFLLNQFIDGTLSPEGERELFLLSAENDAWRSELTSALKVQSVLKGQVERLDVPTTLTASVFGVLGYESVIATTESAITTSAIPSSDSLTANRFIVLWDSIASVFKKSIPMILSFIAGIILMWGVGSYIGNRNTANGIEETKLTSSGLTTSSAQVNPDTQSPADEATTSTQTSEVKSSNQLNNQLLIKGSLDFAKEELQNTTPSSDHTITSTTKRTKSVSSHNKYVRKSTAENDEYQVSLDSDSQGKKEPIHSTSAGRTLTFHSSIKSSVTLDNSAINKPSDDNSTDYSPSKTNNNTNTVTNTSNQQNQVSTISIPLSSTMFSRPSRADSSLLMQSETKTEDTNTNKNDDTKPKKGEFFLRMMYPRSTVSTTFKQDDNIGLSNLMLGAYYRFGKNFLAGFEVGREAYYQKFTRSNGVINEQITQYPTLWLGGFALRYELRPLVGETIGETLYPTIGGGIGMAETGYYTRLNGGLALDIASNVSFTLGGEWSSLYYSSTGANFNTSNLGFMYGITVRW
jgi:hypothetical protein